MMIAPDVTSQPLPSVREQPTADQSAFGGGPGAAATNQEIMKVAQETGDIASFEKIRADQTAVEEAQAKASKLATDVLYDPQTGVLSSKGKDSLPAQQDGMKRLKDGLNDISAGLHGESQIGSFNRWALQHATTVNQQMMVHVDKQLQEHDTSTFETLLTNQMGLAALSHGNAQALDLSFKTVNENAQAYAQRNRLDKDATDQLMQSVSDKMHTSVIDGLLKFQPDDSAQKYFESHKDQISPAQQEKITVALQEGNVRSRSAMQSVNIWKQTGGNLKDSFALAEKIDNPEVQEMTKQKLRQLQSDKVAAQEADQNDRYQQALGIAQKAAIKGPVSLRETIPPMLWASLEPAKQDALKRYLFNSETDSQKWTEFSLMSPTEKAAIPKDEFQQEWLGYFAPNKRDQAMKMYNDALGNKNGALSDHDQASLIERSAQETGIVSGLRPGVAAKKLKGDAAASYASFQDQVQEAVSDFERTTLGGRRRASLEETQKIIDQQILKAIPTSTWAEAKRGFGIDTTPPVRFSDIPDDAKEHILEFARQQKKTVTQEQMEVAYQAYLHKDVKSLTKAIQ